MSTTTVRPAFRLSWLHVLVGSLTVTLAGLGIAHAVTSRPSASPSIRSVYTAPADVAVVAVRAIETGDCAAYKTTLPSAIAAVETCDLFTEAWTQRSYRVDRIADNADFPAKMITVTGSGGSHPITTTLVTVRNYPEEGWRLQDFQPLST